MDYVEKLTLGSGWRSKTGSSNSTSHGVSRRMNSLTRCGKMVSPSTVVFEAQSSLPKLYFKN